MRSQKIEKPETQKIVPVTTPDGEPIQRRTAKDDHPPARVVYYIETSDMSKDQIMTLLKNLRHSYNQLNNDKYYVVPVKNRKLPADLLFEQEILDFVNSICDVVDGQIKLKPGFNEVDVLREYVP